MATKKQQVSNALVNKMVGFYGSLDAARKAYAAKRDELRDFQASPEALLGGKVLWVGPNGAIVLQYAAAVFYDRSPDAAFVLPS
jgi:hypothetical protein